MKKRLRFALPNPPLKVLRGVPEEEDLQDRFFARFKDPGSSSEEDDNGSDADMADVQVVGQVHDDTTPLLPDEHGK